MRHEDSKNQRGEKEAVFVAETVSRADLPLDYMAWRYEADGAMKKTICPVQRESCLRVRVEGVPSMRLNCSASHLVELVVGRLFSEGIIRSADDVSSILLDSDAMCAEVSLAHPLHRLAGERERVIPTHWSEDGHERSAASTAEQLHPVAPVSWTTEWVFRMAEEFAADKTAHARTRGVHSAYLSTPDKTLCVREDLGRHNAFDKVVGWALMNQVDLTQCMLFTSGRVPTDMVIKSIRAEIPLLVSKAAVTDRTISLARKYDLALVGLASPSSFDVLNGPGLCDTSSARRLA